MLSPHCPRQGLARAPDPHNTRNSQERDAALEGKIAIAAEKDATDVTI